MMRLGFELAYQRPNYLVKSLQLESKTGAPRSPIAGPQATAHSIADSLNSPID